jgi:hypothetical protein
VVPERIQTKPSRIYPKRMDFNIRISCIRACLFFCHKSCSKGSFGALDCLEQYPNIIRWSSIIVRLADDLGTSKVCKPKYPMIFYQECFGTLNIKIS